MTAALIACAIAELVSICAVLVSHAQASSAQRRYKDVLADNRRLVRKNRQLQQNNRTVWATNRRLRAELAEAHTARPTLTQPAVGHLTEALDTHSLTWPEPPVSITVPAEAVSS